MNGSGIRQRLRRCMISIVSHDARRVYGWATMAPVRQTAELLASGETVVFVNGIAVGPIPTDAVYGCEYCGSTGYAVCEIGGRVSVTHCTCVASRRAEKRAETIS